MRPQFNITKSLFRYIGFISFGLAISLCNLVPSMAQDNKGQRKTVVSEIKAVDASEFIVTLEHDLDPDNLIETLFSKGKSKTDFIDALNGRAEAEFKSLSASKSLLLEPSAIPGLLEEPETVSASVYLYPQIMENHHDPIVMVAQDPVFNTTGGQAASTHAAPLIYTGGQQNYVLRYVCCNDLPIIADPNLPLTDLFEDDNVVAVPEQNELVAVFDDMPIYNGQQFFVRVQRSKGQHYWGWFPLFWLHEVASPVVDTEINTGVSYHAMAKAMRSGAQAAFYKNCNYLHPAGGAPEWSWDGPAGQNYECGEYPIGETDNITMVDGKRFKHVQYESKSFPSLEVVPAFPLDFPAFGYHDMNDSSEIDLEIPFTVGRVETQRRPSTPHQFQRLDEPYQLHYADLYSQSEYAENDDVRIHPTDWNFKTKFPDAGAGQGAEEVEFTVKLNLPGLDIYSPWFDKEIVIWRKNVLNQYKEARISRMRLGGLRIDELPIIVSGKVFIKDTPTAGGAFDTHFVNINTRVGVEFTDIELTRLPRTSFYDGIGLMFSKYDKGLVMSGILETLEYKLNQNLTSPLGSLAGTLYWHAIKDQVEDSIMDSLAELSPRLNHVFGSPSTRAVKACGAIVPPSYKSPLSPHYAFYRNCLDFSASIELEGFVNPADELLDDARPFAESPDHWANVNMGGLGYSRSSDTAVYDCPGEDAIDTCYLSYDKPWWADYAPVYHLTGNDKFDPSGYVYGSPRGGRILYSATGETVQHYWRFLQCLIPAVDLELNLNPEVPDANLGDRLVETCRLPALETVCALYGEGEDLEQMWDNRWGYVPPLSGYLQYCAWAEELRNEDDSPAFATQTQTIPD